MNAKETLIERLDRVVDAFLEAQAEEAPEPEVRRLAEDVRWGSQTYEISFKKIER